MRLPGVDFRPHDGSLHTKTSGKPAKEYHPPRITLFGGPGDSGNRPEDWEHPNIELRI